MTSTPSIPAVGAMPPALSPLQPRGDDGIVEKLTRARRWLPAVEVHGSVAECDLRLNRAISGPFAKRLHDVDDSRYLVATHSNLAPNNRVRVVRLLVVVLVDNAHLVRQYVPLLKHPAGALPLVWRHAVGEVKRESPPRSRFAAMVYAIGSMPTRRYELIAAPAPIARTRHTESQCPRPTLRDCQHASSRGYGESVVADSVRTLPEAGDHHFAQ